MSITAFPVLARSCVIFETLPEAEAFCRGRIAQMPALQFDILDAAGPGRPPLLTIVNESHAATLEHSPSKMRRNTRLAIALFAVGPALIWFDWTYYEGLKRHRCPVQRLSIRLRRIQQVAGHREAGNDAPGLGVPL